MQKEQKKKEQKELLNLAGSSQPRKSVFQKNHSHSPVKEGPRQSSRSPLVRVGLSNQLGVSSFLRQSTVVQKRKSTFLVKNSSPSKSGDFDSEVTEPPTADLNTKGLTLTKLKTFSSIEEDASVSSDCRTCPKIRTPESEKPRIKIIENTESKESEETKK